MSELQNIADQCENVAGPSRKLDAMIYCAINAHPMGFDLRPEDDGTISVIIQESRCPAYTASLNYTSSIDAATSLVPDGMEWIVSNKRTRRQPNNTPKHFDGWAGVYGDPMVGSECDSFAATVALALCSAALQAMHYRADVSTPPGSGK